MLIKVALRLVESDLEFLIQFIQAALRSYFLFRALWSRHIVVKHTGSYDGTSVSGFTSRQVHASCTPQLKHGHTQLQHTHTKIYPTICTKYMEAENHQSKSKIPS